MMNNPFLTGDTLLCDGILEHAKHIAMHVVLKNHFFKIFYASELLGTF